MKTLIKLDHVLPFLQVFNLHAIRTTTCTIFNQTSINTHDGDETINVGFGTRKLLNDNTLILGANVFYDQQFTENHKRTGAGVEAITSIFDAYLFLAVIKCRNGQRSCGFNYYGLFVVQI